MIFLLTTQRIESLECDDTDKEEIELYSKILIELIKVQREELLVLRKENTFEDALLRKYTQQLDLNEARIER